MQPHPLDAGPLERHAPPVTDGVLMRRYVLDTGEQPLVGQAETVVLGEHLEQRVRDGDRALEVVLRQPDLDGAGADPLDLAAQEVAVADLERRGLAEPEAGEGAQCDERPEPRVGGLEVSRTTSGAGISIAASRLR